MSLQILSFIKRFKFEKNKIYNQTIFNNERLLF